MSASTCDCSISLDGLDGIICIRHRIAQRPVVQKPCVWRDNCGRHMAKSHDVLNRNAMGQEVIGDNAPVTAPPDGFCAHDRATMAVRKSEQIFEACAERIGFSVICVIPKS